MRSLLFLSVTSFLGCLVLTPLIRDAFHRLGLLDLPGSDRKIHKQPIPRVGGIAIAMAYIGSLAILSFLPSQGAGILAHSELFRVLPAAGVVFLIGLWDDLFGLPVWAKFAGQVVAAGMVYWMGFRFLGLGVSSVHAWFDLPITVVWLVGCTNAVNLIDGVDGLAAGVGLFATLTMFLAALLMNNAALALAAAPLAAALLGFLRYNFNPASIFLGDSGSLMVGFLLGCFGLIWGQKSATLLGMTAPLMALSVPLLDTCLAVVRRYLRHQPIFGADRNHIHHRLLDQGLSPRRVALLLYAACGVAAGLSLLQSMFHNTFGGLIIVIFCAAAWIGVQHLGYTEFSAAKQLFSQRTFRQIVDAQVSLSIFEEELAKATAPDEYWRLLRDTARKYGFAQARLQFGGQVFEEQLAAADANRCWTIRIPLWNGDYVNLCHESKASISPMVIVTPLAEVLQRVLGPRVRRDGALAPAVNGSNRVEPALPETPSSSGLGAEPLRVPAARTRAATGD
jgi:UDP-GlcNAc:undecaprenyl-phosphate GlcNAc-1-phosphate transferase